MVEGPRVIGRDPIELRERKVREMSERLQAVPRLVQAAIVADDVVLWIGGIEDDLVVIDVDAGQRHRRPRSAAVGTSIDVRLRGPDRFRIVTVHEDLVVIPRIASAVPVIARAAPFLRLAAGGRRPAAPAGLDLLPDALPCRPRIIRPEEAPFPLLCGHQRVDGLGIAPVDPEPDPAHFD